MKKTNYFLAALLAGGMLMSGCSEDFLNNNPTKHITDDMASQSASGLRSIIEGIHNMIYSYSSDSDQSFTLGQPAFNIHYDMLGDDFINTMAAYHISVYRWQDHTDPYGDINERAWDFYYKVIQHANQVITGVEKLKDAPASDVASLKGEAHTLRAWAYYNLVQLFGKRYVKGAANDNLGVIIRKEVTYDAVKRSTVAEVYALIDEDMKIGLENLAKAPDLGRKNAIRYSTACGIAARIALTKSEWADAAKYADLAIQKSGATLQSGAALCDGFCKLSASEWMWGYTQNSLQDFFYASFFATYGYNFKGKISGFKFAVNRDIYDKMGENDARRGWWVCLDRKDPIPEDAYVNYFEGGTKEPKWEITGQNVKFRAKSANDTHGDLLIMRLGEMYYIKAEAEARQGKDAEAKKTLEEIMVTRDPDYKTTATGNELIEEILRNRRIDLWAEGQRFFDMKRLGVVPDRLHVSNITKYLHGKDSVTAVTRNSGSFAKQVAKSADANAWQFAIPYAELRANKLCEQNPF